MDLNKYNQIPTEFSTAASIGLPAQTLTAYARRGMVEVLKGKPNKYRRIDNSGARVYEFLEKNKHKYNQYFTLHKADEQLGMMCSLVNGEVVDCWGNKYDLTGVVTIEIKGVIYKL